KHRAAFARWRMHWQWSAQARIASGRRRARQYWLPPMHTRNSRATSYETKRLTTRPNAPVGESRVECLLGRIQRLHARLVEIAGIASRDGEIVLKCSRGN